MQFSMLLEGNLSSFAENTGRRIAEGSTNAAERLAVIGKLSFRDDIRSGGLGDKLANTWQAKVYPGNKPSLSPAVFLYSKAPMIVNAFTQGVTITHHDGLWLAIPTDNVPMTGKGGGRRRASPQDVEVIFNQDLIITPGHGRELFAFVDAVKGKTGRLRRATSARTGRTSRKAELILMFVLVPQVTLRKRLNWPQRAADLNVTFADLLGQEIAAKLS